MAEDMRPLSMDDYTDAESIIQRRQPLVERLGLVPYGARGDASMKTNLEALGRKRLL